MFMDILLTNCSDSDLLKTYLSHVSDFKHYIDVPVMYVTIYCFLQCSDQSRF